MRSRGLLAITHPLLAAVGLWAFWVLTLYLAMVVLRVLGLCYHRPIPGPRLVSRSTAVGSLIRAPQVVVRCLGRRRRPAGPRAGAARSAAASQPRRAGLALLGSCLVYPLRDGPGVGLLVFFPPWLWLLSLPVFDWIAIIDPLAKGNWALGLLVLPIFLPLLVQLRDDARLRAPLPGPDARRQRPG